MEDLWTVQRSGVDLEDIADMAEYRRYLKRFSSEEEDRNRRHLLYGFFSGKDVPGEQE